MPRWSLVVLAVAVTGCGSAVPTRGALLGSRVEQDCTAVSDVLSDGPDPGADPVGYAQAQVLPLEHVQVAEPALRAAVAGLAAAYRAYSSAAGVAQKALTGQVTRAEDAVNAICPGVAS